MRFKWTFLLIVAIPLDCFSQSFSYPSFPQVLNTPLQADTHLEHFNIKGNVRTAKQESHRYFERSGNKYLRNYPEHTLSFDQNGYLKNFHINDINQTTSTVKYSDEGNLSKIIFIQKYEDSDSKKEKKTTIKLDRIDNNKYKIFNTEDESKYCSLHMEDTDKNTHYEKICNSKSISKYILNKEGKITEASTDFNFIEKVKTNTYYTYTENKIEEIQKRNNEIKVKHVYDLDNHDNVIEKTIFGYLKEKKEFELSHINKISINSYDKFGNPREAILEAFQHDSESAELVKINEVHYTYSYEYY